MTSVKKDPYLKTIIEDIETGGPTVMIRYLNDSEITQKLAQAMGFGVSGGNDVCSVEHNAPNAENIPGSFDDRDLEEFEVD
ncbi:hypothetical protein MKW98_009213 [Papaver atlanticum]|uniref:Uncharacterized protein n=1 Tax=Papaver atlanticum TaxID=357466 RepID=A0AAD4XR96_9MAGN|nr:hypothetical protein MKW98_009213 [Papaver atlanticum]